MGLQYGPGYRTLEQAWGGNDGAAVARLRVRSARQGTQVHPADLDDALCLSAIVSSSSTNETRLPFAVDAALLQGAPGQLWAVVERQQASDVVSVWLGALSSPSQAQLDGFKSRALRAEAPTQHHLYATIWRSLDLASTETAGARVLVLRDEASAPAGCERLGSAVARTELALKLDATAWSVVVSAVAMQ